MAVFFYLYNMSLRFTNTEKWDDAWFFSLKPLQKLLFNYMCDNCNIAGLIEFIPKKWAFAIGVKEVDITNAVNGITKSLIFSKDGTLIFISTFLKHQKNFPLNDNNSSHVKIVAILNENLYKFGFNDFTEYFKGGSTGGQPPIGIGRGIGNGNGNTLLPEIKISDVPEENKQFYTIALTFHDIMQSYLTKLKIKSTAKHTYGTWTDTIRLMFENDKRTVEEFREVAEYLKKEIPDNNGFSWQSNIRSADTLRKQFEKVLIKARQIKLAKKELGTYRKITEPNLMES